MTLSREVIFFIFGSRNRCDANISNGQGKGEWQMMQTCTLTSVSLDLSPPGSVNEGWKGVKLSQGKVV